MLSIDIEAAKLTGSYKDKDREDIVNLWRALGDSLSKDKIQMLLARKGQENKIRLYEGLL